MLMPLSALAAAYLTTVGGAALRLASAGLFAFDLAILITNGSRTPVVMALASLAMFWFLRLRTVLGRLLVIAVISAAIALSTSYILLYRGRSRPVRAVCQLQGRAAFSRCDGTSGAGRACPFSTVLSSIG